MADNPISESIYLPDEKKWIVKSPGFQKVHFDSDGLYALRRQLRPGIRLRRSVSRWLETSAQVYLGIGFLRQLDKPASSYQSN